MSRPIRSYPEAYRKTVILRRLKGRSRGIGFWSAMDAAAKHYNKDAGVSAAVPKRDS